MSVKSFKTLATGVNAIKTIYSTFLMHRIISWCVFRDMPFQLSLMFVGKAGTCPSGAYGRLQLSYSEILDKAEKYCHGQTPRATC